MNKNWISVSVLTVAFVFSASTVFACGEQAKAADAKSEKTVAANTDTKGCDKPCCAHADAAVADRNAAPTAAEKPCSATAMKGCPKKAEAAAAAVAKAEPAKVAAKAEPAVDPGAQR